MARTRLGSVVCFVAALTAAAVAQGGGARPPGVIRGADQPNQNRWNAKGPWGKTERSAPISAQKKAPFKIFDNVYYIGLQTVSVFLVNTSAGLVLIDAGYAETVDWIAENVRTLGFDPADVEYIFVTHAHPDHVGGAARLTQLTGARVGLSAEDWETVTMPRDLVLRDNETIAVGDTTFTFYFTPGHTVGSTSIEFPVRDGGRTYRALTPGGLGLHYAPQWGPTFKKSMERLRALGPFDVLLGNHPFLGPRDLEEVEAQLKQRGTGPHPAVLGPASINGFFDAILKIVDEKLVAEPA